MKGAGGNLNAILMKRYPLPPLKEIQVSQNFVRRAQNSQNSEEMIIDVII
jgi:hypothetical protein